MYITNSLKKLLVYTNDKCTNVLSVYITACVKIYVHILVYTNAVRNDIQSVTCVQM